MKRTSLYKEHQELGARMVEFGGWEMPVQYGSILDEVRTVRSVAGLFDLGHMGRFEVRGPDAVRLVDRVSTNHCAKIPIGSIRYSLLCREDGFAIDDLLVYRDEDLVYLVVNASNTARDLAFLREHAAGFDAEVVDLTDESAMLAVQGPASRDMLQHHVQGYDLAELKYYKCAFATVCGMQGTRISRTGYTGENGFEIYFPTAEGPRVWKELLESEGGAGLKPIGLGARDTLRLEAGMPLYGHEIDAEHNPIEAGLEFGIALTDEKGDFLGRRALESFRAAPERRLVGLTTPGPRVPRQGYPLVQGSDQVGHVTSGAKSPTLDTNIAMAYVRLGSDTPGTELEMEVRGKRQACVLQELPFYSRTRKKKTN